MSQLQRWSDRIRAVQRELSIIGPLVQIKLYAVKLKFNYDAFLYRIVAHAVPQCNTERFLRCEGLKEKKRDYQG